MSVLTGTELELYNWAVQSLPEWYASDDRANEFLGLCAKVFAPSYVQAQFWLQQVPYILQAPGPTSTEPDWLNQHARDRGTNRANGETDAQLRYRLRNIADAITRPALLAAVNAILAAAGYGVAAMVELPRDSSYLGDFTSETGTGGTFALISGTTYKFTPNVKFRGLPYNPVFPQTQRALIFSGAASGGNNGTFVTTGVDVNGAKYVNGSAVAGLDNSVSWTLQKRDLTGNVIDGWRRSYFSRGYRFDCKVPTIIVILPYAATLAVELQVTELLRQKAAAGIRVRVERRLIA